MTKLISKEAKYLILFPVLLISISILGQQEVQQNYMLGEEASSVVWEKAMVNAAGGNNVNGVDVFYRTVSCNSKKQVILKFVNNNAEDVLIEWADGVYTQDKEWIHNERTDKTRELKLKANKQINGSCESSSEESLRIDIEQYVSDPKKTFRFAPSYIDVTK